MNAAAPGWYHAEGDPPGTERYWDGSQWTDGPRPIGGDATAADPGPAADSGPASGLPEMDLGGGSPGASMPDVSTPSTPATPASSMPSMPDFSQPGGAAPNPMPAPTGFGTVPTAAFAENSQATTALVVSILGLVCCLPAGGIGAFMANKEKQGIAAGLRDPSKQGTAQAAYIIGLIAVGLFVISLLGILILSATG